MPHKITEIWAFVSVEPNGDEGVIAANLGGTFFPLIAADVDRLNSLRPLARNIVDATGVPVKVLKFSNFEIQEEILCHTIQN